MSLAGFDADICVPVCVRAFSPLVVVFREKKNNMEEEEERESQQTYKIFSNWDQVHSFQRFISIFQIPGLVIVVVYSVDR